MRRRTLRLFCIVLLAILFSATALEMGLSYRRGTILEYHQPNRYFACTYTGVGILGLQIESQLPAGGLGNKPGWNAVTLAPDPGTSEWFATLPGPRFLPVKVGFSPFGERGLSVGVRAWFLLLIFGLPLAWLIRSAIKDRRHRGFEMEISKPTPTEPAPVLPHS